MDEVVAPIPTSARREEVVRGSVVQDEVAIRLVKNQSDGVPSSEVGEGADQRRGADRPSLSFVLELEDV